MNFAIIGASGNVGRKTIEILEKSEISLKELYLVASKKSAGKKIKFREKEIEIENLENYDFSKAQITIFAAGSQIAEEWAPKAAKETIVIDNSSFFRMQKNIPLVVPEVNSDAKFYPTLSFDDAISQNLKVMDATALTLARDHKLPIKVFNVNTQNALKDIICGKKIGTLIS